MLDLRSAAVTAGEAGGVTAVVLVVVLLVGLTVYFGAQDAAEWSAYAASHHCTVLSTRAGHSQQTSGFVNGKFATGTTWVDGETCWSCDAGPRGTEVCR